MFHAIPFVNTFAISQEHQLTADVMIEHQNLSRSKFYIAREPMLTCGTRDYYSSKMLILSHGFFIEEKIRIALERQLVQPQIGETRLISTD